jgi:hypothetical protein
METKRWTYGADLKVLALLGTRSESELSGSVTVGVEGGTGLSAIVIERGEDGLRIVIGVTVTSCSWHGDGTHVGSVGWVDDSD